MSSEVDLKNRTRGNRAAKRDDARAERQRSRAERPKADIGSIDGELLLAVITASTDSEGAIRIGLSRDGGAFSFGIYGDGEPYTEYVGPGEDVNEYLRHLLAYLGG